MSYDLRLLVNYNRRVLYDNHPNTGGINDMKMHEFHYIWLAYEWSNLYPVCKDCNRNKEHHFPVVGKRLDFADNIKDEKALLVDPCQDLPEEHLSFEYDGIVYAKTKKGKHTIDLLELNRNSLINDRKKSYDECEAFLYNSEDMEYILSIKHRAVVKKCCAEHLLRLNRTELNYFLRISNNKKLLTILFEVNITEDIMDNIAKYYSIESKSNWSEKHPKIYQKTILTNLKVTNIRGITFDYEFKPNGKTPCLMILGENGTGKTTLLQSIVLGMINSNEE